MTIECKCNDCICDCCELYEEDELDEWRTTKVFYFIYSSTRSNISWMEIILAELFLNEPKEKPAFIPTISQEYIDNMSKLLGAKWYKWN